MYELRDLTFEELDLLDWLDRKKSILYGDYPDPERDSLIAKGLVEVWADEYLDPDEWPMKLTEAGRALAGKFTRT